MKHWAQFYRYMGSGFQEPCGDRGIIQIDARLSRHNMHLIAQEECRKRGFHGYRLMRGDNLLNLFALTANIIEVK